MPNSGAKRLITDLDKSECSTSCLGHINSLPPGKVSVVMVFYDSVIWIDGL
jgi:hypothetical protein